MPRKNILPRNNNNYDLFAKGVTKMKRGWQGPTKAKSSEIDLVQKRMKK